MKKIYLFIACFLTISSAIGQEIDPLNPCGTESSTNYDNFPNSQNSLSSNTTFTTPPNYCINVFFRIIAKDDGSGIENFNPSLLTQITNKVNQYFSPHQISFVNTGYNIVNNSNIYNGISSVPTASTTVEPNSINIFLSKNVLYGNRFVAGVAFQQSRITFVTANFDGNYASIESNVQSDLLAHELGHLLNLKHTFECFNVQQSACSIQPCAELPDGSNCLTGGDLICDTPADPYGCNLVNLSLYNPDKKNIMSYYKNQSSYNFTNGQGERMRIAILNASYLQSARSNQCAVIEGPTNLCNNGQFSFSITAYGNPIVYNWTAGPNLQIVGSATNATVIVKVTNPSEKLIFITRNSFL